MTRDEQKQLAASLALKLRTLADACERAAEGDWDARDTLSDHIDGHWHGLVVKNGTVPGRGSFGVQRLLADYCTNPKCGDELARGHTGLCAGCAAETAEAEAVTP